MSEFDAVGANTELADMSKYYIAQIYFTQGNYDRAIESGEQLLKKLGTVKPGQQRRPGSVMNPNDHPHGGGEGKSPVGRPGPVTPWGKPAMGYKTRKTKNRTDKYIVKRRNAK